MDSSWPLFKIIGYFNCDVFKYLPTTRKVEKPVFLAAEEVALSGGFDYRLAVRIVGCLLLESAFVGEYCDVVALPVGDIVECALWGEISSGECRIFEAVVDKDVRAEVAAPSLQGVCAVFGHSHHRSEHGVVGLAVRYLPLLPEAVVGDCLAVSVSEIYICGQIEPVDRKSVV